MSTALLLITHGSIGLDMLNSATEILGSCPLPSEALAVHSDSDPDVLFETASRLCAEIDQGEGILVLTDLFGSTPSNIAMRLKNREKLYVISGVNLPMLLRIFNYATLDIDALCKKAINGARNGINICLSNKDV